MNSRLPKIEDYQNTEMTSEEKIDHIISQIDSKFNFQDRQFGEIRDKFDELNDKVNGLTADMKKLFDHFEIS